MQKYGKCRGCIGLGWRHQAPPAAAAAPSHCVTTSCLGRLAGPDKQPCLAMPIARLKAAGCKAEPVFCQGTSCVSCLSAQYHVYGSGERGNRQVFNLLLTQDQSASELRKGQVGVALLCLTPYNYEKVSSYCDTLERRKGKYIWSEHLQ